MQTTRRPGFLRRDLLGIAALLCASAFVALWVSFHGVSRRLTVGNLDDHVFRGMAVALGGACLAAWVISRLVYDFDRRSIPDRIARRLASVIVCVLALVPIAGGLLWGLLEGPAQHLRFDVPGAEDRYVLRIDNGVLADRSTSVYRANGLILTKVEGVHGWEDCGGQRLAASRLHVEVTDGMAILTYPARGCSFQPLTFLL